MTVDRWGDPIAGTAESIAAWDAAWDRFLHFTGDPIAALDPTRDDQTFAMGSILAALYAALAGVPLDDPGLADHAAAAHARAVDDRERAHVAALDLLVAGAFTEAGERWDAIARDRHDFAAVRFAHDIFLHVGDNDRRVRSSGPAYTDWPADRPGRHFIAGQHAFSLSEVGRFDEAERIARESLAADERDLWARHALAHVFEDTGDTAAAIDLLRGSEPIWVEQDMLATHLWWHLALRLLSAGDIGGVLEIFDAQLPQVTTAFRLCDMSSLLWRCELVGHDVGDRWDVLADRWDEIAERHSSGFLDLHAAITYLRRPDHPGAGRWFDGLDARPGGDSEVDHIFDEIVKPLVAAFRARTAGNTRTFCNTLDLLGDTTARIGGSNAQRALITLTREATPA